jgi:hypothetical protein
MGRQRQAEAGRPVRRGARPAAAFSPDFVLTIPEGDPENRSGAVTVNVPEANADKIAADFASAEVCVLLSPSSGLNEDDHTAGSCA